MNKLLWILEQYSATCEGKEYYKILEEKTLKSNKYNCSHIAAEANKLAESGKTAAQIKKELRINNSLFSKFPSSIRRKASLNHKNNLKEKRKRIEDSILSYAKQGLLKQEIINIMGLKSGSLTYYLTNEITDLLNENKLASKKK